MTFAHPLLAIVACALPVVALAAEALAYAAARNAFVHPNTGFLSEALALPAWIYPVLAVTNAIALGAIVFGAAGPYFGAATNAEATIAICIDTSGSMISRDVTPTRARAAAAAVHAFAAALPRQTRVALVAFAGVAQIELAPTADRSAFLHALASLPAPNGQTAIGDALLLAGALLPREGPRGILVLTDGKNNRGVDPDAALRRLRAARIPAEIVQIERGADLSGSMRRFAKHLPGARIGSDWTLQFVFAGLALLAAAWIARERGAFLR